MKKLLASLVCVFAIAVQCFAATWNPANRVSTVGANLLKKNNIPTEITFKVVNGASDNTEVATTKVIQISDIDLASAGNDNEIAAVIAHELGHIVCNHTDKNKVRKVALDKLGVDEASTAAMFASSQMSAKDEEEADLVGVDLMINANYNPLAMVVLVTKYTGSSMDVLMGRPNNADRAMDIFDYLTYKYPEKVKAGYACNEYRYFLTYANPIVEKRNKDKKALAKFNKTQAKNLNTRAKNLAKYKATGGLNAWGMLYDSLIEEK